MIENKINVAIVDRFEMINQGVAQVLKDLGFSVTIRARDEVDFYRKLSLADSSPTVCLVDIDEPSQSKFNSARFIRKAFPNIKIIGYSVYDSELDQARILDYGIDHFIERSCKPQEVKAIIERLTTNL